MKTNRLATFSLAGIIGLISSGCGDTVQVVEASGNAIMVLDIIKDKPINELQMTVNRIRVWLSTPNNNGPGVVDKIDQYAVEIWATLAGEPNPRYHLIDGLRDDGTGNLFPPGNEPGIIRYDLRNTTGNEISHYLVTSVDGLVLAELPAHRQIQEEISTNKGSTITTSLKMIDAASIDRLSPWANVKYRKLYGGANDSMTQSPAIFSRTRSDKNAGFSVKGKMGCAVQAKDAAGNLQSRRFQLGDVELGDVIHRPMGLVKLQSSSETASASSGNQISPSSGNYLRIDWTEYWYLTGINIRSGTFRMFQAKTAPFYTVRELPNVDELATEPQPSSFENLVRTCNHSAGPDGKFYMFSLKVQSEGADIPPALAPETATYSEGSSNSYCDKLEAKYVGTNDDRKSIDLKPADFGCGFNTGAIGGTWNGTTLKHEAAITGNTSASHFYVEQSPIVTVNYGENKPAAK
ncbi:MAG: hypothetical protein HQK54_07535 [Oligoflexales bacterium]|nr:hypothetical protein [Oligoflexales bacterium]